MRAISAYIKPTNRCNVGCSHCYLPEAVRASGEVMSRQTLAQCVRRVREVATAQHASAVAVIWHGGEPMALSPGWYRGAGEVLAQELAGMRVAQTMQSAMLAYHGEWGALIHECFDGHIGSSIDFHARRLKGSVRRYQELWCRKVAWARADGVEVTPTMVPCRADLGREAERIAWFVDRGFREVRLERYNAPSADPMRPSNAEHSGFLIGVFDAVMGRMAQGRRVPGVNVLEAAMRGVVQGVPGDRWGTQCQRHFLVFEPNGNINSCPDRTHTEPAHSNVADATAAILASPARRSWVRRASVSNTNPHCAICPHVSWCRGGCPITANTPGADDPECSGYRRFLDHVARFAQTAAGRERVDRYLGCGGSGPGAERAAHAPALETRE